MFLPEIKRGNKSRALGLVWETKGLTWCHTCFKDGDGGIMVRVVAIGSMNLMKGAEIGGTFTI